MIQGRRKTSSALFECPECGGKTLIRTTKKAHISGQVFRSRLCQECDLGFSTLQSPDGGGEYLNPAARGGLQKSNQSPRALELPDLPLPAPLRPSRAARPAAALRAAHFRLGADPGGHRGLLPAAGLRSGPTAGGAL